MADSTTDNFDWVTAQGGCTAEEMFKRLHEGAQQDVERRNASGFGRDDGWRFEVHSDDDDHFEVTRVAGAKSSAFVTFERVGPRINVHTHCNAGALACVEWGTALGVVRALQERDSLGHVYLDEGYSGASLNRPGLDALRDAAAMAEFEVLLVSAPDRLARNYVHQV